MQYDELVGHALDDERTRLRCFGADCVDLLLSCRIIPGLCFLLAVEGNDDESLRRSSIEGGYFFGAGDVATALSRDPAWGSCRARRNGFETFGVGYLANVNDNNSWWFLQSFDVREYARARAC